MSALAALQQNADCANSSSNSSSNNRNNRNNRNNNNNNRSNNSNNHNHNNKSDNKNGNHSTNNGRSCGNNTGWSDGSNNNGRNNNNNNATAPRFCFDRSIFPADTQSNHEIFYCFTHGWDKDHKSNTCVHGCPDYNHNVMTHVGTGGNPLDRGRTVAPSSRGLVGYVKDKTLAIGTVQQTRASVWQANSVMQPAFMT